MYILNPRSGGRNFIVIPYAVHSERHFVECLHKQYMRADRGICRATAVDMYTFPQLAVGKISGYVHVSLIGPVQE